MKKITSKKIFVLMLGIVLVAGMSVAPRARAIVTAVSITSPTTASKTYVRSGQSFLASFNVTATSTANADLQITMSSGTVAYSTTTATVTTLIDGTALVTSTVTVDVGLAEGSYNLDVQLRQPVTSGTWVTSTQSAAVVVDDTAPAVTITSIAGNGYINNSEKAAVAVVGTAEANSTITVTLWNGVTSTTGTANATSSAYTVTLNTTALPDGTINASTTATDAAGNVGIATTTATKDVSAPTAPVITMIAGDNLIQYTERTAIHATGTAETSGTVTFTLFDGSGVSVSNTGTATAGAYDITFDASTLADGTISASTTVADAAGNVSGVTTSTLTKDTAVAALTTDAATGVTRTTATMNGTITAVHGGTPTDRGFEYGLSSASYSKSVSAGSGSGSFASSLGSNDFSCDTTYYYRAYATNVVGTAYGSGLTFNGACTNTSNSNNNNGGGGGGGSSYQTPSVILSPVATPATIGDIQTKLAAAIAQLNALRGVSYGTGSFTKNLTVGSVGEEVRMLQQYLNNHGFVVASSGAGSPGNETTRFGGLTRTALAKFQASVGISPAAGYFGPLTRAYINSH